MSVNKYCLSHFFSNSFFALLLLFESFLYYAVLIEPSNRGFLNSFSFKDYMKSNRYDILLGDLVFDDSFMFLNTHLFDGSFFRLFWVDESDLLLLF